MPPWVKRLITWLIVIFVVWFILSNPTKAAADGQSIIAGLRSAGRSLSTFFGNL